MITSTLMIIIAWVYVDLSICIWSCSVYTFVYTMSSHLICPGTCDVYHNGSLIWGKNETAVIYCRVYLKVLLNVNVPFQIWQPASCNLFAKNLNRSDFWCLQIFLIRFTSSSGRTEPVTCSAQTWAQNFDASLPTKPPIIFNAFRTE